jgi:hypothetical protein
LTRLSAGQYDVQVTVAKPGGGKVAFWRAPVAGPFHAVHEVLSARIHSIFSQGHSA